MSQLKTVSGYFHSVVTLGIILSGAEKLGRDANANNMSVFIITAQVIGRIFGLVTILTGIKS